MASSDTESTKVSMPGHGEFSRRRYRLVNDPALSSLCSVMLRSSLSISIRDAQPSALPVIYGMVCLNRVGSILVLHNEEPLSHSPGGGILSQHSPPAKDHYHLKTIMRESDKCL